MLVLPYTVKESKSEGKKELLWESVKARKEKRGVRREEKGVRVSVSDKT